MLLIVAIVCIAAAITFALTRKEAPSAPRGGADIGFHCPQCNVDFTLSQQKFVEGQQTGDVTSTPKVMARCPQCGQVIAERTRRSGAPPADPGKTP